MSNTYPSRRRKSELWIVAIAFLSLLCISWLSWQARPVKWTQLASNSLASVRIEQALYPAPRSSHYFIRVRVTNLTAKPLGINLLDNGGLWSTLHLCGWGLAE